jgi:hypothetical protein
MNGCSTPVGTTWRGRWRRATPTPAGVSRASTWMSCVPSPATPASTPWSCSGTRQPRSVAGTAGGRPPSYGPAEVALLRVCWAATDGICSQRLAAFLPELLQRLRRWQALEQVAAEPIARVAHLSPATSDRALASSRDGLPKRGLSPPRPGTLWKHQVASKTFADWTETVPGCVAVDLVAPWGWTGAGPFLYPLTRVDGATGGVSCAGLRDKRAQTVLAAPASAPDGAALRAAGPGRR